MGTQSKIAVRVVIVYVMVSVVGALALASYVDELGGFTAVPRWVLILFGPLLALTNVHLLPAYCLITLLCLPLLIAAATSSGNKRRILIAAALLSWMIVGIVG